MDCQRLIRPLVLPALLAFLNGCAMHTRDANGNERIVGFVDLEVSSCDGASVSAGRRLDLEMLGIGVIRNESGTSFNLGYTRERSAGIRDHALILGDWKQHSPESGEE